MSIWNSFEARLYVSDRGVVIVFLFISFSFFLLLPGSVSVLCWSLLMFTLIPFDFPVSNGSLIAYCVLRWSRILIRTKWCFCLPALLCRNRFSSFLLLPKTRNRCFLLLSSSLFQIVRWQKSDSSTSWQFSKKNSRKSAKSCRRRLNN